MQGRGAAIMNSMVINPRADLARSGVSCNDNAPFDAPDPADVIDELMGVFNEVSRLVFSVVTTEPDAGCQYWPVDPPERFEGPWNCTLRNPILVLSNTVSRLYCGICNRYSSLPILGGPCDSFVQR